MLFSSVKCSRSLVVGVPAPPKKRPPPFVQQSPASRIMRQYTTLIPYKFHYFAPHSSFLINTSLNSNDDDELLVRASAVLKSQGPENCNANFENERAVLMWHLLLFWLGPNRGGRRAASRRLASIAFQTHFEVRSAPNRSYLRSDRTGASGTPTEWGELGLLSAPSCWSELGNLVLGGAPATRRYFRSVSRAASR